MNPDEPINPYAAPKSSADDVSSLENDADAMRPLFSEAKFSVPLLFVIYCVTLGLYLPVWMMQRRRFLNRLDSPVKLSLLYPLLGGGALLAGIVLGFLGEATDLGKASEMAARIGGIVLVFGCFRVRRMLNHHFVRTRFGISLTSGWATFFFSILYLQWKINRAAEVQEEKASAGR